MKGTESAMSAGLDHIVHLQINGNGLHKTRAQVPVCVFSFGRNRRNRKNRASSCDVDLNRRLGGEHMCWQSSRNARDILDKDKDQRSVRVFSTNSREASSQIDRWVSRPPGGPPKDSGPACSRFSCSFQIPSACRCRTPEMSFDGC